MDARLPRDRERDHTEEMAQRRRTFVAEHTGVDLHHLATYSQDPEALAGNIEHFTGVAQVPVGIAGPLRVRGEEADGDFLVPLATTEGTLVASYNRGMRLAREAGGVFTTVLDDAMQRAPVFVFDNARQARDFGERVERDFEQIRARAEETTGSGRLRNIEQYAQGNMRWLRFNFTTGDAAGQNMVSRATRQACRWLIDQGIPGLRHFSLAANLDTDKKHSHLNTLHSRGKRVVAEVVLPAARIREITRVSGEALHYQRQLSNMGALVSASVNNGSHFANGITALFIACGQDVANVAESASGHVYGELRDNGDYYFSVTLPSLIVATHGGGTGLATQRECLEMLGCHGSGRARKFAEIVAATVLCGELSLSAAIVADEWVSSHEQHGRNR